MEVEQMPLEHFPDDGMCAEEGEAFELQDHNDVDTCRSDMGEERLLACAAYQGFELRRVAIFGVFPMSSSFWRDH